MAARALSFGISVVNGKRQSDDHDDQNDEFVVAHAITPFGKEGLSQAPSASFLPGVAPAHSLPYIADVCQHFYMDRSSREGTLPCAALTCFAAYAIITAGRDDAFVPASPL